MLLATLCTSSLKWLYASYTNICTLYHIPLYISYLHRRSLLGHQKHGHNSDPYGHKYDLNDDTQTVYNGGDYNSNKSSDNNDTTTPPTISDVVFDLLTPNTTTPHTTTPSVPAISGPRTNSSKNQQPPLTTTTTNAAGATNNKRDLRLSYREFIPLKNNEGDLTRGTGEQSTRPYPQNPPTTHSNRPSLAFLSTTKRTSTVQQQVSY